MKSSMTQSLSALEAWSDIDLPLAPFKTVPAAAVTPTVAAPSVPASLITSAPSLFPHCHNPAITWATLIPGPALLLALYARRRQPVKRALTPVSVRGGCRRGPRSLEVGEEGDYTYRFHTDSCGQLGSDERYYNVSLAVRGKVTKAAVCLNHNFWRERRAEAESNRSPSAAYQPNALPLGQAGSLRWRDD